MRRPSPATTLLAILVGVSTLLRFWGGTHVPTPWVMPDEVIYGEHGESLWASGRFRVLGQPSGFLSLVYPALAGIPLSLGNLERGYHVLKLVQALVMSLTAVPVYLWTRTLASRPSAFAAAALTLAIPGLAFSGLIMTEVAFYPVVVLAAFALARALERPTAARQALLVAACALAAMTRLQAFVLLPVVVTAALLDAALRRRLRSALALAPAVSALVLLALAWAGWRLRNGGPLSRVFGGYEPAGHAHYHLGSAARFVLYHYADVVILTAAVPVSTLVVLIALRDRSPALRAYVATATALCLWLPIEVGLFASQHVGLLAERNLLPLAPVLFVGLAAWLGLGAPRPRVATVAAAALPVALLIALPVRRFVGTEAFPDAFTLYPLIRLADRAHPPNVHLILVAAGVVATAGFALLPRRMLAVIPLTLLVFFAASSVATSREIGRRDRYLESISTGPDHRWIDREAHGPTAFVYIGEFNWPGPWENLFWNRRVTRVYDLLTARIPGGLPQESIGPLEDGRLLEANGRPARAEYAAALYPVEFQGQPLATVADGLILWRLRQPFRMAVWTQRVAGHVRVLAYACRGGSLRLKIVGPEGARVELSRNDAKLRTFALPPGGSWTGTVAAKARRPLGKRLCTFDVVTDPRTQVPEARYMPPRLAP
ncbi:MAG TPA: glycosyltransferase family 39 protein [Gaiellaceae bacterium]